MIPTDNPQEVGDAVRKRYVQKLSLLFVLVVLSPALLLLADC